MNKFFFTIISFLALAFLTNCSARKTTPTADPLTTDIGVTINGITWATRNVDAPGTFAANPEDAGMLFQFNRRKGWSAVDEKVEDWDRFNRTGTKWYAENDPCPEGWRVPTEEELQSLVDAGSEWVTQNNVKGRLFGTASGQLFLPAAGWRGPLSGEFVNGGMWGLRGNYWSSTPSGMLNAVRLNVTSTNSVVDASYRAPAFSVRCVKIK